MSDPGGYRGALERTARSFVAAVLGVFVFAWVTQAVEHWAAASGPARVGVVVFVVGCAALAVALRRQPGPVVVGLVLAGGLLVHVLVVWPQRVVVDPGVAMVPLEATALIVAVTLPPWWVVAAMTAVLLALPGLLRADRPMFYLFAVAALVAAPTVTRVLRRAAVAADGAATELQVAAVRASQAAAADSSDNEIRSLLHDEAVVALRAVREGLLTEAETRAVARRAARALHRTEQPASDGRLVDLVPLLAALQAGSVVTHHELPARLDVPRAVADAVQGAAAEALRNVDRHARASAPWRVAAGVDDGVCVRVLDDGVGAVPRETVLRLDGGPTGLVLGDGLRRSVAGRLGTVGGTARLGPRPGGGTQVRLAWSPHHEDEPVPDVELLLTRSLAVSAVPIALVPAAVGAGEIVGGHGSVVAVWTVLTAVALLAVLWRDHRPGLTVVTWLAVGLSVAGTLVYFPVMVGAGDVSSNTWALTATQPLLAVLAVLGRWRPALVALLAELTVVVVAMLRVGRDLLDWVGGPVLFLVAALAVGLVARAALVGLVRRATELAAARRRADAEQARAQIRAGLLQRRLLALRVVVGPFLLSVGVGARIDDAVRRRADELENMCRDELRLPQLMDDAVRSALLRLRGRGVQVRVQGADVAADLAPGRLALTAALDALTGTSDVERAVVTVQSAPVGGVLSVVVLGGPADPVTAALAAAGFTAQALPGAVLGELSLDPLDPEPDGGSPVSPPRAGAVLGGS